VGSQWCNRLPEITRISLGGLVSLQDRQEAHDDAKSAPEALQSVIDWLRKRSLPTRILMYAAAALLTFAVAVGVGATTSLIIQGDLSFSALWDPLPGGEQDGTPEDRGEGGSSQRGGDGGAGQEMAAAQQDEGQSDLSESAYVSRIGELQGRAVEAFSDSHNKLLRYDSITAEDIEEMQNNEAVLQDTSVQTERLTPPSKFEAQYGAFDSAIEELYEATRLAHDLAADPVEAAEIGFDGYDEHVSEADHFLRRSNEMLGRNYRSIEGVREISPELGEAETVGG
jgi:hypothetical protein